MVQIGISGAEDSAKATVYEGVLTEAPQLQLVVLDDLERADVEEGGVALHFRALPQLGIRTSHVVPCASLLASRAQRARACDV